MQRPLIGITAYNYIRPNTNGWRYDVCYGKNAAVIEEAGGLPVLIPSMVSLDTLRQTYERLDGVLLPGGGDIEPSRYNTEPNTKLFDVSAERDEMEISLAQWAIEDDLPVFGICRGIQVLNVAMGGSLVQDIPTQLETDLRHSITSPEEEARHKILHDVTVEPDSRLAEILGDTTVPVNSLHHQSLQSVAERAKITAHAPDGIVEGIELPDKHFVLAVQWHPEDLVANDARMNNLFTAFVQAAQARMQA
ncbi:MAG: gamma-glutamyl-gamma-aminobutyrate hydrolase family protein [Chloroflexota bacterium]